MTFTGIGHRWTALMAGLLLHASIAWGQVSLVVQPYSDLVPTPTGYEAYRLFAVLEDEEDFLTAVFGDAQHPLSIQTTGSFLQTQFGSGTASGVLDIPSNEGDSWIALDAEPGETDGTLIAGIGSALATFETGQDLIMDEAEGGSWFLPLNCAPNCSGQEQGFAGTDRRILLGQFVTDGVLTGTLNLLVLDDGISGTGVEHIGLTFSSDAMPATGCMTASACNYDPLATVSGTCDFQSCLSSGSLGFNLETVHSGGELDGFVTIRIHALTGAFVTLVGGDAEHPLTLQGSWYNHPFDGGPAWAGDLAPDIPGEPNLVYDSWVTIGTPTTSSCLSQTINSPDQPWQSAFISASFSGSVMLDDAVGGGWYIVNSCSEGIPVVDSVLIAQITFEGDLVATIPFATIVDGSNVWSGGSLDIRTGCMDPAASNFREDANLDNGSCSYSFLGCINPDACNYDSEATDDDGSCHFPDTGLDCTTCLGDSNGDGVCEHSLIEGCTNPLAINYDPMAGADDGSCTFITGCTYPAAPNFNPNAVIDDGSCDFDFTEDWDGDGIPNDDDPCFGTYDSCGVCEGSGPILDCGCVAIPDGDCDCDGNQLDALGVCGGSCAEDLDGDGICDNVDPCIGEMDACGLCNGPGAVFDCGCAAVPVSDCDCNGNQLDAIGECGGTCTEDLDGDGLCDDEDPCVGALDVCGVCNGPGDTFECGCADIPDGDCDCNGNQFDALGVCGGDCAADLDGDGVCDVDEVPGCTNPFACNYDATATDDDGTCAALDAIGDCGGLCTADLDGDGLCDDDDDPCVGSLDVCGVCNGPGEIFDCGCAGIPNGDCDCDGNQLDALGVCGGDCAADLDGDGVCDVNEVPGCTNPFACNYDATATDDDGTCEALDAIGDCGGQCTADLDGDGLCDDDDDPCVGSVDVCGVCNGPGDIFDCGCAGIPDGDCDCNGNQLDALGVCGGDCAADLDGDGVCDVDEVPGCTNPFACNYDATATDDDGTCLSDDAIGVCGGTCTADVDGDGICDGFDPCVGSLDVCGVCNGPGEIFDCGCAGIPDGDCDCNGNQLDALGVCGGNCAADLDGDGVCDVDEVPGCTDVAACNFDPNATDEDGSCLENDALGICGGDCTADMDGDGICDVDEVPGCTSPFACNYNAAATDDDGSCLNEDAIGVCGGPCTADADGDGLCDDIDACVGTLDVCGVCNGPGEIFDCGCAGIPDGDCDCNGNQLDALGVCGGDCAADLDGDGVCDVDEVIGCVDPLACNFDPDATEQGGACFYEDAIGVCGGTCLGDADGDGICDTEDTCFGDLDACGVCNGPGAIYSCGCDEILPGACDCDGNMPDAVGVCDGDCEEDDNGNGICDDLEESLCGPGTTWNPDTGQCEGSGGGGDCPADLNGDGVIAVADLLMFLTQLGNQCPD